MIKTTRLVAFALSPLALFPLVCSANAVSSEVEIRCRLSNGWTIAMDGYYDGHPQGPGGWSGVARINDWGKFTVAIPDESTWAFHGRSGGPSRLENYEFEGSLVSGGRFRYRIWDVMAGWTPWTEASVSCP